MDESEAAFGVFGNFFGHVSEIWIPFVFCGFMFGISSFLQFPKSTLVCFAILLTCMAIGRATGLLYQKVIRKKNLERFRKWSNVVAGLLFLLVVLVTINSWLSLLYGIFGALF